MLKIRNKPARIAVKWLSGLLGFVLLVFACLSAYVELNKKELLNKLRQETSKTLGSEITYKDADITIWRNFPHIGIHLYQLNVADSLYQMPIISMKEVQGQVSIFQVFRKNVQLRNLTLKNGRIHLFTDTSGYTNKYLLQPKKQQDTLSKSSFMVHQASLINVNIILENRKRNKLFNFLFHQLDAEISSAGELLKIDLNTKALVKSMGFNLEKGSYLKDQEVQLDANLIYNKNTATLSFSKEDFVIDDQSYQLTGNFMLRGDGHFDLNIQTKQAPYAKLQKLFPQNIGLKLQKINLEKPIDVDAKIGGPMAYKTVPVVNVKWRVKNNTLTTEVAKFTNCSFDGSFNNQQVKGLPLTDENSAIVLSNFTGNWDGINLKGKEISISNLVNPYINFNLSSTTDLATLEKKIGLETIDLLSGTASLNLSYAGPLITDISILDHLNGQLQFNNSTIRYVPRNFNFTNCSGIIAFSRENIKVHDLKCTLGKSQFVVNAHGNNLSGLSTADAGSATINCSVYTPSINIGDLTALFAARKKAETKAKGGNLFSAVSKVDQAMDHGSLNVQLNAGSVSYNKFSGSNLKATIIFRGNDLSVKDASINHANGTMQVNANITQSVSANHASAKVKLNNVDVKQVFHAFDNFGQDGIETHNIKGSLTANTDIALSLTNNGTIVPGTIKGIINFSLRNGALVNYEPLMEIKKSIFKNKDMSNVTFAELKNKLEVDGYKVKINRMEVQSSAIGMFVDGLYDIKKEDTKINIQVPLRGLKQRDSTYIPKNIGLNAKAGTSVYLEGKVDQKTGKVKFGLNTTRTLRKLI